jgi:hypothetical protein
MSSKIVRNVMSQISASMGSYSGGYWDASEITEKFLQDVSLLQQQYGAYIGEVRAKHSDYWEELNKFDQRIEECFAALVRTSNHKDCFKVVNVAMQIISQVVSFGETLEALPEGQKVTKQAYEKVLDENKALNKAIEIVRSVGHPELNSLLEKARRVGLETDETWVLALCSSNLIEEVVNKKLEELNGKVEGDFKNRYNKLCELVKSKEGRDISRLLPLALYNGVRNKLDHATPNKVTPKEAKDISEFVRKFIDEIFPLRSQNAPAR